MNARQRWSRIAGWALAAAYLAGYAATWACGEIDYRRILRDEKPLFARWSGFFGDGGTQIYQGFGYKVLRIHSFSRDEGLTSFPPRVRYDIGAQLMGELRWLFPLGRPDHRQTGISETPDRKDT